MIYQKVLDLAKNHIKSVEYVDPSISIASYRRAYTAGITEYIHECWNKSTEIPMPETPILGITHDDEYLMIKIDNNVNWNEASQNMNLKEWAYLSSFTK